MKTKTVNILISSLIVGLLVCAGILVQQHVQLNLLREQLSEQAAHIYQVEKASEIRQANRTSIPLIRSLSSGIYELTTEVAVDPLEDNKSIYTIYHFVLNIEVGAFKRWLHFGYASSGVLSHIFYFDYDGDGKIDTSMMNEYVESIPAIGKTASWLVDPELSQSLYNAFRLNSDNAEKLSMDEIATRVGKKIEVVWEWIEDSSSDFGEWVQSAVDFD